MVVNAEKNKEAKDKLSNSEIQKQIKELNASNLDFS